MKYLRTTRLFLIRYAKYLPVVCQFEIKKNALRLKALRLKVLSSFFFFYISGYMMINESL